MPISLGKRQLLRLDLKVDSVWIPPTHLPELVPLEDVEADQRSEALRVRRRLVNGVPLVLGPQRLPPIGAMSGQIVMGEPPLKRLGERDDGLGDGTLVKGVAATGRDLCQRPSEIPLVKAAPRLGSFTSRRIHVDPTLMGLETLEGGRNSCGHLVADRKAVLCQIDGRRKQIGHGNRAVRARAS